MYESFYKLRKIPFHTTPDTEFLFLSPSHKQALANLIQGVEKRKGLIVITGEPGLGKTMITRSYIEQITDREEYNSVYIFNSNLSFDELLTTIYRELDLGVDTKFTIEMLDQLQRFLADDYARGGNTVIVIDDAQNLPIETLVRLHVLSNLETPDDKLIQIVLVGQPELDSMLCRNELNQIKSRIALRTTVEPLTCLQSLAYIRHRLEKCSTGDASIFTKAALMRIARKAEGSPRLINILCDNALISGFARKVNPVNSRIARDVISDLEGKKRAVRLDWKLSAIGVILVLIVAVWAAIYALPPFSGAREAYLRFANEHHWGSQEVKKDHLSTPKEPGEGPETIQSATSVQGRILPAVPSSNPESKQDENKSQPQEATAVARVQERPETLPTGDPEAYTTSLPQEPRESVSIDGGTATSKSPIVENSQTTGEYANSHLEQPENKSQKNREQVEGLPAGYFGKGIEEMRDPFEEKTGKQDEGQGNREDSSTGPPNNKEPLITGSTITAQGNEPASVPQNIGNNSQKAADATPRNVAAAKTDDSARRKGVERTQEIVRAKEQTRQAENPSRRMIAAVQGGGRPIQGAVEKSADRQVREKSAGRGGVTELKGEFGQNDQTSEEYPESQAHEEYIFMPDGRIVYKGATNGHIPARSDSAAKSSRNQRGDEDDAVGDENGGATKSERQTRVTRGSQIASELADAIPDFDRMTRARQRALIGMAHEVSVDRMLEKNDLMDAINEGDYDRAAEVMIKSRWKGRAKNRVKGYARMLRDNEE